MSVQDPMPSLPLVLPVALTIRQSRDIAETLRAAFEHSGDVVINVPEAADADLSFIQLLEASRRYAETLGRSFSLSRPAEGSLLSTLARGGFLTDMTPQDSRFWLHGKEQMQ
ncbi:STAS domain-containing protein [Rhizobium sp. 9140]|nr:STAS domain-containing protein [Rhizobium sp. 9140]